MSGFYFCHGGSRSGFKLSESSAVSDQEKSAIKKAVEEKEKEEKKKEA